MNGMGGFILCAALLFTSANGKCLWRSDGSESYIDGESSKTFNSQYLQSVQSGDDAVVIQEGQQHHPLVLDKNYAYYNGSKFATGHWVDPNEWRGQGYGGGSVLYRKDGNEWTGYYNGNHLKTFRHIRRINASTSSVILEQPGHLAKVLIDSRVYFEDIRNVSGDWAPTCYWHGRRDENGQTAEFKRISASTWQEYDNNRLKEKFHHVHTVKPGAEAVVLQRSCEKPLILDKNHVYHNRQVIALGRWNSHDCWTGVRLGGDRVKFIRHESAWREIDNGRERRLFQHVQSILSDRSAVVTQQNCSWPLILDDTVATYNGDTFAVGNWREEVPDRERQPVARKERAVDCSTYRQINRGHYRRVRMTERPGSLTPPPRLEIERWARMAIGELQMTDLDYQHTVVTHEGVRIDIQNTFHRGRLSFRNIQVQIGRISLAQASVQVQPEGVIVIRDVRDALQRSLNTQHNVEVQIVECSGRAELR